MAHTRGTNLPQMGGFNQATLLESIRLGGGSVTRADLARRTGLSAQTVTNVVRRLLDEGLVIEAVTRKAGLGRPGTPLQIVPASRYAVGVHVDPAAVALVLVDLAGRVVTRRIVPTPESERPGPVLDIVASEIATIVSLAGVDRSRLIGVGVATPGPIDRTRGLVLDPPNLTMWHDVPLRDEVARRTGLPTLLDKDVLAVAAALLWYPQAESPTDAAVVYAGTGVAVGVISGGEVVRGVSGNAGEAGHLNVGRPFGPCPCGREGCLGGVLSTNAIMANATARGIRLASAEDTAHPETLRGDWAVDELRELGLSGHEQVLRLLDDMGRALGSAVTTVTDLLDLDTVVVSGPVWSRLGSWLEPGLQHVLAAHDSPGKHGLRLLVGDAAQDAAVGAACLTLDDALTPRTTGLLLRA